MNQKATTRLKTPPALPAAPRRRKEQKTADRDLARELLLSTHFEPPFEMRDSLSVAGLVGELDASEDEVRSVLATLTASGFLRVLYFKIEPGPSEQGTIYTPTKAGFLERERLLHALGWRHSVLMRQREHALPDLILALAASGRATSQVQSMIAQPGPIRLAGEFETLLSLYRPEELDEEFSRLVTGGFLKPAQVAPNERAFELTGLGTRRMKEALRNLGVSSAGEILLISQASEIRIFNAWQSEVPAARNLIEAALARLVAGLASSTRLPIRIVQADEAGDGASRLDARLLQRIRDADFVVGDLTPVHQRRNRLLVNQNVLFEVGYALRDKDEERIILLALKRPKVSGRPARGSAFPFDLRHVRRFEFQNPKMLDRWLEKEFRAVLRRRGWLIGQPAAGKHLGDTN